MSLNAALTLFLEEYPKADVREESHAPGLWRGLHRRVSKERWKVGQRNKGELDSVVAVPPNNAMQPTANSIDFMRET